MLMETKMRQEGLRYQCLMCGSVQGSRQSMRVHMRDMHVERGLVYMCPLCRKTYKSRNTIANHVSRNHPNMKRVEYDDWALNLSSETETIVS